MKTLFLHAAGAQGVADLPEAGIQFRPEIDSLKGSDQIKGIAFKGQGRGISLDDPAAAGPNSRVIGLPGFFHTYGGVVHAHGIDLRCGQEHGGQIGPASAANIQYIHSISQGEMGKPPASQAGMPLIHHGHHQFSHSPLGFACVLKKLIHYLILHSAALLAVCTI